jgi:hypothetical protein
MAGATRPVLETRVDGYVSCHDPRCPGYEQKPVQVIRETVQLTYRENGARDGVVLDAVERESVYIRQTDQTCEYCGGPVILSDQERPEYDRISGQDPLALLDTNFQQRKVSDVEKAGLVRDKELAELRAREAERDRRDAERDRMFAEMQAELQRRRGGRPPKTPEEGE